MKGFQLPASSFQMRSSKTVLVAACFALALSCTPAGPEPSGRVPRPAPPVATDTARAPIPPASAPRGGGTVRVGLTVEADSVVVSGTGGSRAFELVAPDGRVLHRGAEGERVVVREEAGLRARVGGRMIDLPEPTTVRAAAGSVGYVMVDNAQYRGAVLLRSSADGGVTAINTLDLETYLLGVVPREIPVTQFEAVKAQAVAARTYAVGQMGRRESLGFDFYASVQDQVYGGIGAENDIATRAVAETAGEILTYNGRPIDAFYHSTCGGRTASIDEVWRSEPVPYLRSVSDAKPGGGAWCDTSSRYRWTVRWTGDELRRTLARTLAPRGARAVDDVQGVEVESEGPSGRAEFMRIVVDDATYRVRGDSLRWVLRTPNDQGLNSALLFDVRADVEAGEITSLEVDGGGWGHGIGMCQVGAMGRAAAGQTYREILGAYYQGATLTRIY
ncbi:MAG TPA: SpoIID/LytB domain-containing protein [Longimicrobiales bacterium]